MVAGVLQMLSFKKQKNMIEECGRYNKKKKQTFSLCFGCRDEGHEHFHSRDGGRRGL